MFNIGKKKVIKLDRQEFSEREARDALKHLELGINSNNVTLSSELFFNIVNNFFSDFFKIKGAFTHSEFAKLLEKKKVLEQIKNKAVGFSDGLVDMKYKSKFVTKKKLLNKIKEFKEIISYLVSEIKNQSKYEQISVVDRYIKSALKKGKSNEYIEKELNKAGWPSAIIKSELSKTLKK